MTAIDASRASDYCACLAIFTSGYHRSTHPRCSSDGHQTALQAAELQTVQPNFDPR